MRFIWKCICIIILSAAAMPCQMPEGQPPPPEVNASIRVFEAWLQGQMTDRQLPGVAVGVVHDQRLIWAKGFGYADLDRKKPITTRTLFRMASNTKPFTAMAILQLRDAGKLRLDDPVAQYLPWFKLQPSNSAEARPVTIGSLLMHASGLPREAAFSYWNTRVFPSAEEVRTALPNQRASFFPEARLKYSNLAFTLAGMLVEKVTDVRYSTWMQTRILGPLGMVSSGMDLNAPELAAGYGRRMPDNSRERIPFIETRAIAPAAGLTSNVEDLARYVSLQFRQGPARGPQILSGATLQEMHRVHFLDASWKVGFGLGFATTRVNDRSYVGHDGHIPGYTTSINFVPDEKVGVIVLTNADDSRPDEIAIRALQMIGSAIAKSVPPAKKMWDESWRRYAGLYRSDFGDLYVVAVRDELVMLDPVRDNPVEGTMRVAPQSDGSFLLEGKHGGWEIGEPVRFLEKNGIIQGVTLGTYRYDRVE